jgi:hypothetical protein
VSARPLVAGFLKVRDEIVRENNIARVLANMEHYVDAAVICDDASTDGTREETRRWCSRRNAVLIEVPPAMQDFRRELEWKQRMLEAVHAIRPRWILWMDGDEVLDAEGTANLRRWVEDVAEGRVERAWAFHYSQFWRSTAWARTDSLFDDGWFVKLWRYAPDLAFRVEEGTHRDQFPRQIGEAMAMGLVGRAPYEVLHYGNFGKNLVWKCVQYWGGLGGVDRHLVFPKATYRPMDQAVIPEGCERVVAAPPEPFTDREIALVRAMQNLRGLAGWFTIVIPAYNRAATLARALDSVLAQTYESWVAVVLDDGSTDETPAVMRRYQDLDPRIFYARYPANRGGVAMNEIGMALACEWTEFWTRLGSDDWFGPTKLAYDAAALSQFEAVYGTYVVVRDGKLAEACNPPREPEVNRQALLTGGFVGSWANCAVRTSVLRAIRQKYGNFCDPRLRNMEDFLVNARVARETPGWVWRGRVNGQLVVNPPPPLIAEICGPQGAGVTEVEAVWTAAATGASGNALQYMRDENLTRQLLVLENVKYGGG